MYIKFIIFFSLVLLSDSFERMRAYAFVHFAIKSAGIELAVGFMPSRYFLFLEIFDVTRFTRFRSG